MMFRRFTLVAVAVLTGCGGIDVDYLPLNAPPRPMAPRPVESVQLFETPPQRPYVEVGAMECHERSARNDMRALYATMRASAAEHGCDALVIVGTSNHGFVGTTTLGGYRASCIVFTDPEPPPPPPQPAAPPPPLPAPAPRGT